MARVLLFLIILVIIIVVITLVAAVLRRVGHQPGSAIGSEDSAQTSRAYVVDKRTDVSNSLQQTGFTTRYFATFELPSSQRLEFELPGAQYGQLVIGDVGELTWQGSRLMDYRRELPR